MAVITISRQFGAGGITLGKMVAEKFGYIFADTEVIKMVAEMANVSTHFVETVEKEAGGKFSKFISKMVSKPLVERILKDERGYIDEEIYLDYLVLIIAQMADDGDVVILGRGSQYILNDHPDAYHILLIDEFENRVRFMQEHYDLSKNRAIHVVKGEDKRRKNLYQKLGKTDYDNPSLYHLVLNMSKIDLDQALQLVCKLVDPHKL
ncbi:MAG: cytidylate kinase-like family protein [Deltaproteobacteria bacterium]|nr:cytidylate kinase-like family protein [Deltaproteobacteria bacterium]